MTFDEMLSSDCPQCNLPVEFGTLVKYNGRFWILHEDCVQHYVSEKITIDVPTLIVVGSKDDPQSFNADQSVVENSKKEEKDDAHA